ncbi:MAG: type II toxin-antitoxin system VapC family toxin [Candidatus Latescibacterota bacterium]|jgi:predicted nucleic acid-binding protein
MDRRYVDADVFLGLFNQETDKVDAARAMLEDAIAQDFELVTSALTLAEVIHPKDLPRLSREGREQIRAFFAEPPEPVVIVALDRFIAEKAQELLWSIEKLAYKDAIHVATAVELGVTVFYTFDGGLLDLNGMIGDPPLRIAQPGAGGQMALGVRLPSGERAG